MRYANRLNNISSDIWARIARIDELKGSWTAGANLNPQILRSLKQSVLITSSGASTRIEGSKLSDKKVEELMRGIAIQKFPDRDSQEVKSYYELLKNVFDAWDAIKFSENTIKHFHRELLKYVEKDALHRGEYKKSENKVVAVDSEGRAVGVLFETAPAYLTPKFMQELVEWTSDALSSGEHHPLLVIGNFIVEFLKIHPFTDGNGRLSRILTNLLLLQSGYAYMPYVSHEKLVEAQKPVYYMALRKSQKTFDTENEDLTPWLEFFLDILLEQSKKAVALLSAEHLETVLSPKQLLVWRYFEEVGETSPLQIVDATGISRATVSQVLAKLISLKKIERLGMGRSTRYRKD